MKTLFIILGEMEASGAFGRCGRAMTRCECAEMAFDEVVRLAQRDSGAGLEAVQAETGIGLLCTACLPDLHAHLRGAGVPVPADEAEVESGTEPTLAAAHEAR
jgi:hypothetical protein